MNGIRVSVVVVAYYGDNWMTQCVETLGRASSGPVRVVVVDNAGNSTLGQLDFGRLEVVRLSCPHPMGFADANNFALANGSCETEFVCFLNQDTLSDPGWLDACVNMLDQYADLAAVTPLIHTYDRGGWDPSFLDCARTNSPLYQALSTGMSIPNGSHRVTHIPAAAMVVRSAVLQRVGAFDPIFGSYYEDYDLCARIRAAEYQVAICADASICHFSGSATNTPERERKRQRQIVRNRVIYEVRHSGRSRLSVLLSFWMWRLPRNLLRGLIGTPSSQHPKATLAAAVDLLRLTPRLLSRTKDERSVPGLGAAATA